MSHAGKPTPRHGLQNLDEEEAPQVNAYAEPYAALARHGEWSTGFFDICASPGGAGLCCTAMCCPCVTYGRIAEDLPPVSSFGQALSRDSDGVVCGGSFWGACLTFCALQWFGNSTLGAGTGLGHGSGLLLPCQVPLHLQLRTHMRSKYGMQGDSTTHLLVDVLAVWCCAPCALCQEARELAIRQAAEHAGLRQGSSAGAAARRRRNS